MVPHSIACLLLNLNYNYHQVATCPFISHSKMADKYDLSNTWWGIAIGCFFFDIREKTSTFSILDISITFKNNELQIDNMIKIRYGDIHSVSLFGHPVVVLSSLEAINEFRAASPENFSHRWNKIKRGLHWLQNSLINIEGGRANHPES